MLGVAALSIAAVSYRELFDAPNAKELFAEYAAECSLPELGAIDPQGEIYKKLEAAGSLRCFVARSGHELIGFATLLIYVLPHYGKKVAATESIFVPREQRASGIGNRLLTFIEDHARENGCAAVLYTAPTGSQFDRLLGLKYRQSNSVYVRSLS